MPLQICRAFGDVAFCSHCFESAHGHHALKESIVNGALHPRIEISFPTDLPEKFRASHMGFTASQYTEALRRNLAAEFRWETVAEEEEEENLSK